MVAARSVYRVGGLAGVLSAVALVAALIVFLVVPTLVFGPGSNLEDQLADFPENNDVLTVGVDLFTIGFLLLLPFLAGLYWSLREPSRVFARIGLGSGTLATIALILVVQGLWGATSLFSPLYADATAAEQAGIVATYTALVTLVGVGASVGVLFLGLAFAGFGIAMRESPEFPVGLSWLSLGLGVIMILLVLATLGLLSVLLLAVLLVVLGWKLHSLSRTA